MSAPGGREHATAPGVDPTPDSVPATRAAAPAAPAAPSAAFAAALPDPAALLESITDAFFAVDAGWRFTYLNARAESLLARARAALLGTVLWESFPEAVALPFWDAYHQAMATRATVAFEAPFPPLARWFAVRAYPAPDGGLAVYFQDVTEARRVREQLQASEERFRAVQEASPDGFMLFRSVRAPADGGGAPPIVDFEFAFVNAAAARTIGRPAEALIGRRLLVEMPGNRDEGLFDAYVRVVETGEPWQREFAYQHEGLDHAFRATAVRVADGFGVTFSDVTARHRVEAELRATSARLRFLAEASRALAVSLDVEATLETTAHLAVPRLADACVIDLVEPDGRVRRALAVHRDPTRADVARAYARRYPPGPATPGSPAAEALRTGRTVHLPTVDAAVLATAVADAGQRAALADAGITALAAVPLAAGGRVAGVLTLAVTAAGGDRRLGAEEVALAEELAHRAATALEHARLFAEAEAARAEAEQANRAKSQFLATMSHELRTPLNAILGYADLIEAGVAGAVTPAQLGYVGRMKASGRHLLGLIDDVLDFAKIEAGQLVVAREAAPIGTVATAALELVRPQAAAREVTLAPACAPGRRAYRGDEDRVRQILVNLLSNAVKFTPAGGSVSMECDVVDPASEGGAKDAAPLPPLPPPPGGWVRVRVRDTGIGIPADKLEAVFEPFVQVDREKRSQYARNQGGAGLGLAISRQFARLMDGDLTVTSTPGVGSTFALWLPAAPAARADPGRRAPVALGRLLAAEAQTIVERLVARLRLDPHVPLGHRATQSDLEDHLGTFLVDVAQQFTILDEPGADAVGLVRDGSELQQLLAEKHGAQRQRLGWDEPAVLHEFVLLADEVERAVRAALAAGTDAATAAGGADDAPVPVDDLLALARAFLHEAAVVSLAGWRRAAGR